MSPRALVTRAWGDFPTRHCAWLSGKDVAFSPDGKILVLVRDSSVVIHETATMRPVRTIPSQAAVRRRHLPAVAEDWLSAERTAGGASSSFAGVVLLPSS
jgi:hypothetical protein